MYTAVSAQLTGTKGSKAATDERLINTRRETTSLCIATALEQVNISPHSFAGQDLQYRLGP